MPVWLAVIILGIIEGITEFLPVSSTGHLLIAERWLPHQTDLFNIVIQCGAVLAVLPLFPDRLRQFLNCWGEKPTQDYALKILVAFGITAVGGFILEKKHFNLTEKLMPVAIALAVGGILFVVVESWLRGRPHKDSIAWPIVFAVGFGQLIAAVFPGSSRSGTTILLALVLGLNRVAATEFSFLVGIPTMLAAGGWKIFKALRHHGPAVPQENWAMVGLAFVVAAVVSFIAVKWLLTFVRTHTFIAFGWYRIALAAIIALLLLRERHPASSPPTAVVHPNPIAVLVGNHSSLGASNGSICAVPLSRGRGVRGEGERFCVPTNLVAAVALLASQSCAPTR